MSKGKPGVMLYWETFDVLDRMTPEQISITVRAIRRFAQYGETPDFTEHEALDFVWPVIESRLVADAERYEERCKQTKAAANTRWERERNSSASERMQTHADACESTINPADTTKTGELPRPIPLDSMHLHTPASERMRNMPTTTPTSTPTSTPISSTAYALHATAAQGKHTGMYRDEFGRDYITRDALKGR